MGFVSRRTLICAAVAQTVLVAALSVALVIPLGSAFFKHWGWLIGPAAWLVCAYGTAAILRLPRLRTLAGAVLCGIPSAIAVLAGEHTVGEVAAIVLFAIWCAWRRPLPIAALNA
jgi:hypothetical protein